ncbi:hypothetical protein [Planomonospora venezuelensis]|uniref:Uncharacterized protein n=1 Tax=Planomonospora venezuelensis TaxID=1999 RepID=A0A841D1P1_PLAVE|nr:hypothetical protein [Planomonospora venezuelensis]MBB5961436.1 hypothetical protein [Planomonospora venezuelensis]GIN03182.1 hypothetical protein Pve01_48400 [Planomonospora venezuelensis]
MTYAYGLPSDPQPYTARHRYAARRPRLRNGLGLASLTAGGVAVLATAFTSLASWASALVTLASVALGFAALGRAEHRPRRAGARGRGWPGLVAELAVGAAVIWAAIVLLTALGTLAGGPDAGPERTGGAGVRVGTGV